MKSFIVSTFLAFSNYCYAEDMPLSDGKVEWIGKVVEQFEAKGVDNIPTTKVSRSTTQEKNGSWSYSLKKNGKIIFADDSWLVGYRNAFFSLEGESW